MNRQEEEGIVFYEKTNNKNNMGKINMKKT